MIDRAVLRAYATALPAGSAIPVPREWLLDLLHGALEIPSTTSPDLTVVEVAQLFGRAPSTIRSWHNTGRLQGYKFRGRELRFTRTALEAFEAAERSGEQPGTTTTRAARKPVNLNAYRNAS